jgi:hypothetical protein
LSTAVLLYTMRCNISCAHCSVFSGPDKHGSMELEQALDFVDGLAATPNIRYIDISGGEPMLRPNDIIAVIKRIKSLGKEVRVTSNGFWASTPQRAEVTLKKLKDAGLDAIGLSLDKWHLEFLPAGLAQNFIRACRLVGFPPIISCVVRGNPLESNGGAPQDLQALLDYYGLSHERATDLQAWGAYMESIDESSRKSFLEETIQNRLLVNWQYLSGDGRAAQLLKDEVVWTPLEETPEQSCPVAGLMPTIDQNGNLFPCCAPWVNHKNRAYAQVDSANMQASIASMRDRPALKVIREFGPRRVIKGLVEMGYTFPACNSGICNLCSQMLDRADLLEMDVAATLSVCSPDQS